MSILPRTQKLWGVTSVDIDGNTGDSDWLPYIDFTRSNMFMGATSDGAPVLTLTCDVSPIQSTDDDASHTLAGTYYETFTITSTGTKTGDWVNDLAGWPEVLEKPYGQIRFKITVGTAAAIPYLFIVGDGFRA